MDAAIKNEVDKAILRERSMRDVAFLDFPVRIAGCWCRMMTYRDYMTLCALDNPFVVNSGAPTVDSVLEFIWQVSTANVKGASGIRKWLAMRRFAKSIMNIRFGEIVDQIENYVEETFIDTKQSSARNERERYSFMASVVDVFASEYGWSDERILDIPIRRVTQYLRRIQLRYDPKAPMFNKISDQAIQKYVDSLSK